MYMCHFWHICVTFDVHVSLLTYMCHFWHICISFDVHVSLLTYMCHFWHIYVTVDVYVSSSHIHIKQTTTSWFGLGLNVLSRFSSGGAFSFVFTCPSFISSISFLSFPLFRFPPAVASPVLIVAPAVQRVCLTCSTIWMVTNLTRKKLQDSWHSSCSIILKMSSNTFWNSELITLYVCA